MPLKPFSQLLLSPEGSRDHEYTYTGCQPRVFSEAHCLPSHTAKDAFMVRVKLLPGSFSLNSLQLQAAGAAKEHDLLLQHAPAPCSVPREAGARQGGEGDVPGIRDKACAAEAQSVAVPSKVWLHLEAPKTQAPGLGVSD